MSEHGSPVNWQEVLELTNNNPVLANEIVRMFADELPQLQEAVNEAYQQASFSSLAKLAHKLHGACCYCGATRLRQLAAELESSLNDRNYNGLNAKISCLNQEINDVSTFIQNNMINNL